MRFKPVIVCVLLVLLAAGCTLQETAERKEEQKRIARTEEKLVAMTLATTEDIDSLDPVKINSPLEFQLAEVLYDTLVKWNESTGEFVPLLASGIQETGDGTGLLINLKEGVIFQDGTALDAESVKASLERWQASLSKPQWFPIANIEIVDAKSLIIYWRRNKQELLAALSSPHAAILSARALAEGTAFASGTYFQPGSIRAGTGPYALQEWVDGRWLTLVLNEDYHGELPEVQRWQVRLSTRAEDALLDFRGGEVDVVQGLDPELLKVGYALGLDEKLVVNKLATGIYLLLNEDTFAKVESRQALAGIINRKQIAQELKGLHQPLTHFIPNDAYEDRVKAGGTIQPDGAARLLELELADLRWAGANDLNASVAGAIIRQLSDKGINLKKTDVSQADMRLILWTLPHVYPEVRLFLWDVARLSVKEQSFPRSIRREWPAYLAVLEQHFAGDLRLIPVLRLRQALYADVGKENLPISPRGYLDLAAFEPGSGA
ncbi:MAG: ABC transporter substrate-binding protein [Thermoanaerobacteraceae bacterium]|nr:ABC transporter substrate-binding protein [Thermoanaerobacteraceae bacterium]